MVNKYWRYTDSYLVVNSSDNWIMDGMDKIAVNE